ncbi:hypothetical protein ACHAXN_000965, partial [Cyclotella atomus]
MVTPLCQPVGEPAKRSRGARASELLPTPDSPRNHGDFPGIDQMIAGSQSSQDSSDKSVTSSTASPTPKRRKGASSQVARVDPCCFCPRTQTCSVRTNCACLRDGRVCTRCDPGTCGKCRNTEERRGRLRRAAEAQAAEHQRQRESFLNSIGATRRSNGASSSTQSSADADPSNGLGDNGAAEDTSGSEDAAPAAGSTANPSSSQDTGGAAARPDSSERAPQQEEASGGDSTSSGSGDGDQTAANSTTGNPTAGANNVSEQQQTETNNEPERDGSNNGGGGSPQTRTSRNTPPTGVRFSVQTGAPDAGSIGANLLFNQNAGLGPHDVGYRVMEDDPKMQPLSAADERLRSVYGDTIHLNDGRHLDGGVKDDRVWQWRWNRIVSMDLSLWDAPPGKVGRRFIKLLTEEWAGVRARKWNSERPIVFCAAILTRKQDVYRAKGIREVIDTKLDLWEAGRYDELVEEVVIRGKSGVAGRNCHSWTEDGEVSDSVARKYNSMMLDGKVRGAVRFATGRGQGGPLNPKDECTKAGIKVIKVLKRKHPKIRLPETAQPDEADYDVWTDGIRGFDTYPDGAPATMPTNFDFEVIEKVSSKLHGAAGPGGVDSRMLKSFLTHFGSVSEQLRVEWARWSEWLCNESPPYAAYRALNAKREVALDKQPGTRPVAIGEIWMRCIGKGLVSQSDDQAKLACGSVQLCAGLECGIESSLHAVREVWSNDDFVQPDFARPRDPYVNAAARMEEAAQCDEEFDFEGVMERLPENTAKGVMLVDATNGFNELNRYSMLWNVRHRWSKGSRLAFNCYRHFNICIVREGTGNPAWVIEGEEGLSQGDPLAMVLYGVALMPLAEHLRECVPDAMTPWYADDSAGVGRAEACARAMLFLTEWGPTYGYYPEVEKSYFICTEEEEARAKVAFYSCGLQVKFVRGMRYLGGFIGGNEHKLEWVKEKVKVWVDGVKILASVAKRFPQTAFAGLTFSLQSEWQYVQRTVPGIAALFDPLEKEIRTNFLPVLLGVESISTEMRELLGQSAKMAGLGLRNPVATADLLFEASRQACEVLTDSLVNGGELNLAEHKAAVRKASTKAREKRVKLARELLDERIERLGQRESFRITRAKLSSPWLTCFPSRLHGTELSGEEFRDNIRLRYNLAPLSMPSKCDGCGEKMTVEHALSCKVGGLVHIRHDDVAEEFGHLCELAFSKGRVTHEPRINACETRQERRSRERGQVQEPTFGGIAEAAGQLNEDADNLE